VPHRIFDDVEEREKGERARGREGVVASRNNRLMSETITSWDNFTTIV
jgi:hypothetical protein